MQPGSMAIPTSKARALGMGAALTLVTLLTCLVWAELREPPSLSLEALTQGDELALMSCDRQADRGTSDLLWCADPDSPLCLPALPTSQHVELWDRAPVALVSSPVIPPQVGTWLTWPRPTPEQAPGSRESVRLERPPRA
jgi:hypothetical protein